MEDFPFLVSYCYRPDPATATNTTGFRIGAIAPQRRPDLEGQRASGSFFGPQSGTLQNPLPSNTQGNQTQVCSHIEDLACRNTKPSGSFYTSDAESKEDLDNDLSSRLPSLNYVLPRPNRRNASRLWLNNLNKTNQMGMAQ